MSEDCPICFNKPGTYTDDPLKTPYHPIESLRGAVAVRPRHIEEIRESINGIETGYGLPLTTWSTIDVISYRHINEMRYAIQRILPYAGITLREFLSRDENGNVELLDSTGVWLDGNPLDKHNVVRGMHIEELRRSVSRLSFDTLFCSVDGELNIGLANKSALTDSKQFFRGFVAIDDDLNYLIDNSWSFNIIQNNILHNFSITGFSAEPVYSYCPVSNLQLVNFKGYATDWDHWTYGVTFNPRLPLINTEEYPEDYEGGSEGINHLTIDDTNDDDYIMYTAEFFYSRMNWDYKDYGFQTRSFPGGYTDFEIFHDYDYTGCPNYIAKYTYPKNRVLGIGNGFSGQTFNLGNFGIQLPILQDCEKIYVDDTLWTRVNTFTEVGSADRNYTLNYTTGELKFGDGYRGMKPPVDSEIRVFLTLFGGGVWKFERIVLEREENVFHMAVFSKGGKLWSHSAKNTWQTWYLTTTGTNTHFSSGFTGTTFSECGVFSRAYIEAWGSNSATNYPYTVTGSFSLIPNPSFEILDSGLGQQIPTPSYSDYVLNGVKIYYYQLPSYQDDNPEHFVINFNDDLQRIEQISPEFWSKIAGVAGGERELAISYINEYYETATYGYYEDQGGTPKVCIWHDTPSNFVRMNLNCSGYESSQYYIPYVPWWGDNEHGGKGLLTRRITKLFDWEVPFEDDLLSQMVYQHLTNTYYTQHDVWTKVSGAITYEIEAYWSYTNTASSYIEFRRTEVGNRTRPSSYVPMEVEITVDYDNDTCKLFDGNVTNVNFVYKYSFTRVD